MKVFFTVVFSVRVLPNSFKNCTYTIALTTPCSAAYIVFPVSFSVLVLSMICMLRILKFCEDHTNFSFKSFVVVYGIL